MELIVVLGDTKDFYSFCAPLFHFAFGWEIRKQNGSWYLWIKIKMSITLNSIYKMPLFCVTQWIKWITCFIERDLSVLIDGECLEAFCFSWCVNVLRRQGYYICFVYNKYSGYVYFIGSLLESQEKIPWIVSIALSPHRVKRCYVK